MQHPDSAARARSGPELLHGRPLCRRERFHLRQLFGQACVAQPVALIHDAKQEGFILRQGVKVAAASQPQMPGHRPFQSAVGCFDVPVLIGTVEMNRARLHPQMRQQLQILGVVAPRGLAGGARLRAQMMGGVVLSV